MARKFKVGDRVRLVRGWGSLKRSAFWMLGKCVTVLSIKSNGGYPYGVSFSPGPAAAWFHSSELELAPTKKKKEAR